MDAVSTEKELSNNVITKGVHCQAKLQFKTVFLFVCRYILQIIKLHNTVINNRLK